MLDGLDDKTFLNARRLANPYETIGKGIFQNRAAMKMANMDQMFCLTSRDGWEAKVFFKQII